MCLCPVLYLVSIIHVQHETDMRTIVCLLLLLFSYYCDLWLFFVCVCVFHSDGLIRWNHLRNNWKVRFHTSSCRKWSNITTCVSYTVTSHLQYKLHILLWTGSYFGIIVMQGRRKEFCSDTVTDDDSCVRKFMCTKKLSSYQYSWKPLIWSYCSIKSIGCLVCTSSAIYIIVNIITVGQTVVQPWLY